MRTQPTPSSNRRERTDTMGLSMRVMEEAGSNVNQVLRSLDTHKKGLTESDAIARLGVKVAKLQRSAM